MQVQKLIQEEFPGTEVIPSNYPVAPAKVCHAVLARFASSRMLSDEGDTSSKLAGHRCYE
jgi:hypothetical protein